MSKLRFLLALSICLQAGCSSAAASTTVLPVGAPHSALSATSPPRSTASQSATVEPGLTPPPSIAPQFFDQVKVAHEYWPAIKKALGIYDTVVFGRAVSDWALSPNGKYVAVSGCDVEAGNGGLRDGGATCDSNLLETVAHAFLVILDANTEELIAKIPETGQPVTISPISFSADSNSLLYAYGAAQKPQTIQIWDIPSATARTILRNNNSLDFIYEKSPKDPIITFAPQEPNLDDLRVDAWNLNENKLVVELPEASNALFSVDGEKLLATYSAFITIYETHSWQKLSQLPINPDGNTNLWAFSPDLSMMVITSRFDPKAKLKVWNTATGELMKTIGGDVDLGKCGRLMFSPDGRLLLRFDDHGAGPVIWDVNTWKKVQANPNESNFVKSGDEFVDRLEFSRDGRSMLVGTGGRLTLYSLPNGTDAAAPAVNAAAPAAAPISSPSAIPAPPIPVMSCDFNATGWYNVEAQPCAPPSQAQAGIYDETGMHILMTDADGVGVSVHIPLQLLRHPLQIGKYAIGDFSLFIGGANMVAEFNYFDPRAGNSNMEQFLSYDGGTITFTQTGSYLSGSLSFGAHSDQGREENVDGVFANVPYSVVNQP